MVTSRTGTGKYRNNRKAVLARAQHNGQTNCPECNTELNFDEPQLPNSAETDHIVPHAYGGTDDQHNLQVMCRACNLAKGDGTKQPKPRALTHDYPLSRHW